MKRWKLRHKATGETSIICTRGDDPAVEGIDTTQFEIEPVSRKPKDHEEWDGSKFVKDSSKEKEVKEAARLHAMTRKEFMDEVMARVDAKLADLK